LEIPCREEIIRETKVWKSEKGVQHMRQDAKEQLKMQENKRPLKSIYLLPYGVIMLQ
jgi:hypothetical protein